MEAIESAASVDTAGVVTRSAAVDAQRFAVAA
jgi:hypothetical protein